MKVFIPGINGFIGSHLFLSIFKNTDWHVCGLDIRDDRVSPYLNSSRVDFLKGGLSENFAWMEKKIKECDVVVPLAAIATPAMYIKAPLTIFELDFEENMKIVKLCAKHNKRLIFPSTSEVYGMSMDSEFCEDTSNLIVGPICKQRWIYSGCKQLLDRVIWALGQENNFKFTLFRPFNWVGPYLDDISNPEDGSSRVMTQFISNIVHGKPLKLVNGGKQKRCFTYIDDGIDCLMKILINKDNKADNQIFNIGNPDNHCSIEFIAGVIRQWVLKNRPDIKMPRTIYVSDKLYYGESYEDVAYRVPNISKAGNLLDWHPRVGIEDSVSRILEFYLKGSLEKEWPSGALSSGIEEPLALDSESAI